MPSEELLAEMMKYNEELVKAGVMLGGDGLHPSSKGVRVKFSGDKRTVIDGPFTEAKELVAGYWLWEVKSLDEAIEWAKRCPSDPSGVESELEIRPVFESEDFGEALTRPSSGSRSSACALRWRRSSSASPAMTASNVNRTIDAVWRIESARLIAGLARIVRDVGLAEDLAHDALVAALEQWPESGVPDNPGAWLMATAKHRAIDRLRRSEMAERKHQELGRELQINQALAAADWDAAIEDVGDDVLRLIFTTCHPVLSREARVALTLRLLGGLTTPEIARAFLVPESTVAQRIVRAKRTLAETNVPFEVPGPEERAERLSSVLEVIYIVFNEGYSATAGEEWLRPSLEAEALRLGRILAALAPNEPEVHGLVALMEIQASRSRARVSPSGEPILLLDQDRGRWDYVLIGRGLAALERAEKLGGRLGPYALQAAIAACHARARTPEQTDWQRIVALYDALAELSPSPVVELNRAVALGMAFGPAVGLELVDQLTDEPAFESYHLLPSVRGDLLEKLGCLDEAREEFERAASLTQNKPERKLLLERAAACSRG